MRNLMQMIVIFYAYIDLASNGKETINWSAFEIFREKYTYSLSQAEQ